MEEPNPNVGLVKTDKNIGGGEIARGGGWLK